ncbi:MAG: HNH endonuclease signature motif containing protein [Lachnospiraceae bacterium]|nr:HNH endonuclease signature motif containing protein [Lachnospiraceae bacterium]
MIDQRGSSMDENTLNWIRQLIRENNLHEFYTSSVWRKTQSQILKEHHYECQRCKEKGLLIRARTVHHKKYLRDYPELALTEENLEPICEKCHYDEHHRKQGFMNEEKW